MRRILILIAVLCFGGAAAQAAEYADRVIIGFSADGAYFAFEEYGVQDGSGFPYSNIYVIETATDSWVEGTPIRVRFDDESVSLEEARSEAYSQAIETITGLGIGAAGRHLVNNPLTEVTDGTNVPFLLRAYSPPMNDVWTITIEQVPLPSDCPDGFGYTYGGFDMWLTSPEGETQRINHDTALPSSRNCAFEYTVSDVIAYDAPGQTVLIVLVNMFSLGFEGPDRRFLAVATRAIN